jgi:cysteinyl-tRNA synthetase
VVRDGSAFGGRRGAAQDGRAPAGVRVAVARVEQAVPDVTEEPDPAALRLALLARPRSEPCRLDPAALRDAHDTLVRWRRAVADWARLPSRPVPDEVRARLRAAWEDDLDVPGVLQILRDVESDPELPDGARFETYAHADRILGLDLVRDLGSPA